MVVDAAQPVSLAEDNLRLAIAVDVADNRVAGLTVMWLRKS